MLWYNAGAGTWYMGGKAALGQRKGILKAHDLAAAPELIKPGMWQLGQGEGKGWLSAPDVHCLHGPEADKALKSEQNALLVAQRTVYLFDAHASLSPGTSGSTAPAWQGAYTIEATEEGRHRYVKPGDSVGIKSAWVLSYNARAGTWLVSRKGKRRTALKTWLSVYDAAQIPDKIQGSWRAWKDGGWVPSSVRVIAGAEGEAMMRQQAVEEARELSRSATTVLLSGTTPGGWGHEWFGAYTQRTGSLVDGRFVFAHEVDDSKALWFDGRSGRWCVGTHEAYEERFHPNKAVLSVVDAALAPERISAPWMLRTDAQTEAWVPASSVRAVASDGREGEALRRTRLREQNSAAPVVYLVGETPASFPGEWMGAYELSRSDAKPNERHVYRRQGDAGKELRYHPKTGDWRVHQVGGGETTTVLSVYDGAELPEQVSTAWRAYSKEQGWQDAPEARHFPRPALLTRCRAFTRAPPPSQSGALQGRSRRQDCPGGRPRSRRDDYGAHARLALPRARRVGHREAQGRACCGCTPLQAPRYSLAGTALGRGPQHHRRGSSAAGAGGAACALTPQGTEHAHGLGMEKARTPNEWDVRATFVDRYNTYMCTWMVGYELSQSPLL